MCEHERQCLNFGKCYRCFNQSLLKLKNQKQTSRISDLIDTHDQRTAMADDSWKDLEQQVADSLNRIPSIRDARRARASGALWFEKGDIVDSILHPECKERSGRDLVGGDKSMSIKREWLEKAAEECQYESTTMCLPFRFKGDKNIYCIFKQEDIATLITTMKAYILDNEKLRAENEALRGAIPKNGSS